MPDAATPLIVPALGALYDALAPWADAAVRAVVGLALVPHGMRAYFGWFAGTGARVLDYAAMAAALERSGYKPGRLWAGVVAAILFGAGPLLALGLLTRPAALVVFVFLALSALDHARFDGYFWNRLGLEYPLIWAAGALFFVIHGGGAISLDRLLLGREF